MVTLRQTPFALLQNDEVKARLRATNLIGTGPYSAATTSGATISTEPLQPPTPPYEGANTDDTQLHIVWNALSGDDTGGEPITVYSVWWDGGVGSWVPFIIQSGTFTYSHTQTSGVTAGQPYYFKYRASNKHGTGVFSDVATIIASTVPEQLSPATTVNSGVSVIARWSLSPSDRGATVTAYRVKWKKADGTYEELAACDGSDATVFANRECTVAMASLTDASTFAVPLGADIFVAVEALNAKGYSTPSADGGGAVAQTPPTAGPTAARGSATNGDQIEVTWAALDPSLNGGSAVTGYELWGDSGAGGALAYLAAVSAGLTRAVTTPVTAGNPYKYAVKAVNVHGAGPLGATLEVVAAALPGPPTNLQPVTYGPTTLTFSWSAPTDTGGVAITDYEIYTESSPGSGIWVATARTGGATSYTATGLAETTSYSFRVAAINAAGTGESTTQVFSMTTLSSGGGGGGGNGTL
jgi:titin